VWTKFGDGSGGADRDLTSSSGSATILLATLPLPEAMGPSEMTEPRLKRAHGNWVSGDRFWDRETELALLKEYLEEGAHLLIAAQRRIGKTSLLREATQRLEGSFRCLFVDLQKSHNPADAIVEISLATRPYADLWTRTRGAFSNILDKITGKVEALQLADLKVVLRSGLTHGDWQPRGDSLLAILAAEDLDVVIFLDELPILVNRILFGDDYEITSESRQETDAFMSWIRESCIRYRGKIRFVITGSIGLEPILRRASLSATLNVLAPFEVGPWNRETASGCLQALANQYGLTFEPEAVDAVLNRLGIYIPHHVQMFFDNIYRESRIDSTSAVSVALVEKVYSRDLLSIRGHAELSHLEERLKQVLGPKRLPLALDMLTEAAVCGMLTADAAFRLAKEYLPDDGTLRDEVREILGIMEHDGYLLGTPDSGYKMISNLLRDWWRARFEFGYVPTSKRDG